MKDANKIEVKKLGTTSTFTLVVYVKQTDLFFSMKDEDIFQIAKTHRNFNKALALLVRVDTYSALNKTLTHLL